MMKKKTTSGFTVMELVIVIAILSIISAFAAQKFIGISQDAKMQKTIADVNTIGTAIVQKFHHLAGISSVWPRLANAKATTNITPGAVVFEGTNYYNNVLWSDIFSNRDVPLSPIDKQYYKIEVINTGSVDYITTGSGTMMANVIDPEFRILWISQDTPPDTISARFRP